MTALEIFFPDVRLPELGKIKIGGLGDPLRILWIISARSVFKYLTWGT